VYHVCLQHTEMVSVVSVSDEFWFSGCVATCTFRSCHFLQERAANRHQIAPMPAASAPGTLSLSSAFSFSSASMSVLRFLSSCFAGALSPAAASDALPIPFVSQNTNCLF